MVGGPVDSDCGWWADSKWCRCRNEEVLHFMGYRVKNRYGEESLARCEPVLQRVQCSLDQVAINGQQRK